MHIVENKSKIGKKIYNSILLRESYREDGKVKKRTIANLSNCNANEITAIKLALEYKDDLTALGSFRDSVEIEEGSSVGAVYTVYQVAKGLGIEKVLGRDFKGKLALWQVIARVIDQGSRLSAVRLAQTHAACDILNINRGFDENDLYENLSWIADNQERMEQRLFKERRGDNKPEIFLYDVTSSYLEGEKNFFAQYGYNRDGKKGKKQIVIGLLCDEFGEPVSTEVFAGNTQDTQTFFNQIQKVAERFGCKRVTFVGDRGMIKTAQIDALPEGFHYITGITKPQIQSLITKGVIQLGLFDKDICEVEDGNIRYILRRNPFRAREIAGSRLGKRKSIEDFIEKRNKYLIDHPKAKVSKAIENVTKRIARLKANSWLKVEADGRVLHLVVDNSALEEESLLDGCYVIKSDLPNEVANGHTIHDRYKDLALVEQAFRTSKTGHLEVRPVFVRTEKSTKGHIFIVMMAYMIIRALNQAWSVFDLTVKEGLNQLSTLCAMKIMIKDQTSFIRIPKPRKKSMDLMNALNIVIPQALPHREVPVVTRKKLPNNRKINL